MISLVKMVDLPLITLDITLAELYRKASPSNAHKKVAQVLCGVNSSLDLSDDFPRNVKYLYQDTLFNSLSKRELTDQNHELQRSLAMKYLSLIPQRDAFISGDTVVVLFNVDQSPEQIEHDRQEAQRTIQILNPKQQPSLVLCPGPGKIPMKENGIDMVACKLVLDQLGDYPMVCELEKHWYINSKEALASSGLPMPKCEIIEVVGYSQEAETCCSHCLEGDTFFIPSDCSGSRAKWLNEQKDRLLGRLLSRSLPFVLRNQQTFGGAGTYVVTNEEERSKLVQDFSSGLLRKLYSQVTAQNYRLKPGTILLSDLVSDPIGDYGLTFFVTENGGAIFLAVSEQLIAEHRAWIGSTINYKRQQQLEEKFRPIMHKIVAWLHSHGYYGPAGADILETERKPVNGEPVSTKLHIADLNIRTSGSLCLPLLRGHFESRGLTWGSSFSITVQSTRDNFIREWKEQFESGRMCILSWYEDKNTGVSIADVALGSENEQRLQEEMQRVREATDDVTF